MRGIRTQIKKAKIFSHLQKIKPDICLLQETHLSDSDKDKDHLISKDYNNVYSATYNSRQRGVAILVHNKLLFHHISTTSDPGGRYVIINCSIIDYSFTIVNIYGPNNDDPLFFHNIFKQLNNTSNVIIAGDFNTVLNPILDRSHIAGHNRNWHSTDTIKKYMEDFGLGDSWRLSHPNTKQYTHTSLVHHSSSRIDFFLISNTLLPKAKNNTIHPIEISDHAPVSLTLQLQYNIRPPTRWRFNLSLLKDPVFNTMIEREWTSFMELNDSPETTAITLWETGKAYIRGKIIAYSSYKKKKQTELENELQLKIQTLTSKQGDNNLSEVRNAQLQLDKMLQQKNDFMIQQLKYDIIEKNNISGKYLANLVKRKKDKSIISSIQTQNNQTTTNPQEINNTFRLFYEDLYTAPTDSKDKDIKSFFHKLSIPQLPPDLANQLDSPLTSQDLHKALKQMPNNKAPGPDGYPPEFYKHFWSLLSPLFLRTVMEIKRTSQIPQHMNTAAITILLKPDKNPTLPNSYRPLSLLNTDLKIITKALAHRLEKVVPLLIHQDQTGFIKNRNSSDNLRRLFNLISISQQSKTKTVIASLDAEKAFDKVNWTFLFYTLQQFGFGESFIHWIKTLYTSPKATVTTNGITSSTFTLHRGTRQGCPLSPSLFALFIEPLAIAIRQNNNIHGIIVKDVHHKISLYADDILLYLQSPQKSLQETLKIINCFSSISDYTINWNKSTVLPLSDNAWDPAAQDFTHKIHMGNIRYLGINISSRLSELLTLNHYPLLQTISDDLNRWTNLPLSIIGRIATVKMKILPKLNYLFANIPVIPPEKWFRSLDSTITKFYWNNKKSKIKLSTLQKEKAQGGLNAPNFNQYYIANQLQYLVKWINPTHNTWTHIEQSYFKKLNLSDLPSMNNTLKKQDSFKNLTISTTLTAWWKALKLTNSSTSPSKDTPLWNNPDFHMNNTPLHFRTWEQKGITHLHHLFNNNNFLTYKQLIEKHNLDSSNTSSFQYLQIKSIIKSKINIRNNTLNTPVLLQNIKSITKMNKLISKLYKLIKTDNSLHIPHEKWNEDLHTSLTHENWTEICKNIYTMTPNTNLQLIQYKIIHRTHITQYKKHKMGLADTDTCSQCTMGVTDTYLHALWECTPIQAFWKKVTQTLTDVLSCRIPLLPSVCLLGFISNTEIPPTHKNSLLTSLTIAKRVILQNWISKKSITINHWTNTLIQHITILQTTACSEGDMSSHRETWTPFMKYFKISPN